MRSWEQVIDIIKKCVTEGSVSEEQSKWLSTLTATTRLSELVEVMNLDEFDKLELSMCLEEELNLEDEEIEELPLEKTIAEFAVELGLP